MLDMNVKSMVQSREAQNDGCLVVLCARTMAKVPDPKYSPRGFARGVFDVAGSTSRPLKPRAL